MVYRFEHDGSGKVVSEAKRGDLESFLGQYFPASDIPQQARALYLRNTIRIISDADGKRIPIVPVLDASGEPLDLSFAHLRSVSPIHCEYLRNMGVAASMSISIIVDGELWGLIACHHYSPAHPAHGAARRGRDVRRVLLPPSQRVEAERKLEAAPAGPPRPRPVPEAGLASGRCRRDPSRKPRGFRQIRAVRRHRAVDRRQLDAPRRDAARRGRRRPWRASWAMSPMAGSGRRTRCRIVCPTPRTTAPTPPACWPCRCRRRPRDYLFFFRKELVQTLDWAGNPEKSYETGPLGDRLTPRKSFAIWKETVDAQSAALVATPDREIAEATRVALVEVVLRHSELLADERSQVRTPPAHAERGAQPPGQEHPRDHQVAGRAPGQEGATSGYVASLQGRIQALAFAHDQVARGEGGGSLADLLEAELTPYRDPASTIVLEGPQVWLDAAPFRSWRSCCTNCAPTPRNTAPSPRRAASCRSRGRFAEGGCRIEWRESGGPIVSPPKREGFGTVLIDRSIPLRSRRRKPGRLPAGGRRGLLLHPQKHILFVATPGARSESTPPCGRIEVGHRPFPARACCLSRISC